jgi:hypothetical protein
MTDSVTPINTLLKWVHIIKDFLKLAFAYGHRKASCLCSRCDNRKMLSNQWPKSDELSHTYFIEHLICMIKKTRTKHEEIEKNSNLLSNGLRIGSASKCKNHHQNGNHKRQQEKRNRISQKQAREQRDPQHRQPRTDSGAQDWREHAPWRGKQRWTGEIKASSGRPNTDTGKDDQPLKTENCTENTWPARKCEQENRSGSSSWTQGTAGQGKIEATRNENCQQEKKPTSARTEDLVLEKRRNKWNKRWQTVLHGQKPNCLVAKTRPGNGLDRENKSRARQASLAQRKSQAGSDRRQRDGSWARI